MLHRLAAEAWRNDAGELLDEEMYPCDAVWSGIYDRLGVTTDDENERRVEIATRSGALAEARHFHQGEALGSDGAQLPPAS